MFRNILVIDLAHIGDVVLTTPCLRSLRAACPEARITMLTTPTAAPIAQLIPYVDTVMTYDKHGTQRGLRGMLRMGRQLRSEHFDAAFCLNFALRGAVITWLAGIPVRVGYDAQHAGLFLSHTQPGVRDPQQHERLNHLAILQPLGLAPSADTSLELQVPDSVQQSLATKLGWREQMIGGVATATMGQGTALDTTASPAPAVRPPRPYIVICPYGNSPKKAFSQKQQVELICALQPKYDVYLTSAPADSAALMQTATAAGLPATHCLPGTLTLPELAALLRGGSCLITTDTGPLHIAQAVGCPTVALFGPTNVAAWGPSNTADTVLEQHAPCAPCDCRGTCTENTCITTIPVPTILAAVHERLKTVDKNNKV